MCSCVRVSSLWSPLVYRHGRALGHVNLSRMVCQYILSAFSSDCIRTTGSSIIRKLRGSPGFMEYIFPILSEARLSPILLSILSEEVGLQPPARQESGQPAARFRHRRELSIFRFSKHPELAPKIEAMKGPPSTYLDLIADIKPLEQRRNAKTKKDTFDLHLWWREILAWGALCSPTRPREFRSRPSAASPSSTTRSTTIRLARAPTTLSTRFSHNTMRAVGRECECARV